MLLHRCMHCLAANACAIKFDRRGKPYTTCRFCFTRCFFSSLDALRGVAIVPQMIETAMAQRDRGEAPWVDKAIADLRAHVFERTQGAPLAPDAPSIVPFVERKEQAG